MRFRRPGPGVAGGHSHQLAPVSSHDVRPVGAGRRTRVEELGAGRTLRTLNRVVDLRAEQGRAQLHPSRLALEVQRGAAGALRGQRPERSEPSETGHLGFFGEGSRREVAGARGDSHAPALSRARQEGEPGIEEGPVA